MHPGQANLSHNKERLTQVPVALNFSVQILFITITTPETDKKLINILKDHVQFEIRVFMRGLCLKQLLLGFGKYLSKSELK